MKKFTLSLALCALVASSAGAAVLTPAQSLARLKGSSQASFAPAIKAPSALKLVLKVDADNAPAVYVFGNGSELVVTSADDIAAPLLGYGINGNSIAPGLKYWLDTYSREIAWARRNGVKTPYSATTTTDSRASIEPLVKTKWNQESPYYNDCPTVDGVHCVTGCVATALAQVMKYHEYPEVATGKVDYTLNSGKSDSIHVKLDLDTVKFDWKNMTDTYDASSTAVEKAAVAQLMFACGASCSMDYTTGESGTAAIKAAEAMVNNFKYDRGIHFYYRDYYGISDWQTIVYDQLQNYGPVQYSGQSTDGGHSFVCDGYSQDGYFHINWGWGGMSDGYFLLTSLTPGEQGVGGSGSGDGFNFDQSIIGNVQPFKEGSEYYPDIVWDDDFTTDTTGTTVGSSVTFTGMYYNFGIAKVTGHMGIKVTPASGTATYVEGMGIDLQSYYGYDYFTVTIPTDITDGTYTVTPAVESASGKWYDVPVKIGQSQNVTMTVSDGTVTFTQGVTASVTVNDLSVLTPLYIGSQFSVSATLVNSTTAEYLNSICVVLIDSDYSLVAEGQAYSIDIPANSSSPLDYTSTFAAPNDTTTLTAGTYYLTIIDGSGNMLASPVQVTLNANEGHELSCTAPAYVESTGHTITMTATVTNSKGYYAGSVRLYIFNSDGGEDIASYGSDMLSLTAGQSANVTFSGDFSVGTEGKTYIAQVFADRDNISDATYFTYRIDTTGITDLTTPTNPTTTRYYDLRGIEVTHPQPGIYIRVTRLPDGALLRTKVAVPTPL